MLKRMFICLFALGVLISPQLRAQTLNERSRTVLDSGLWYDPNVFGEGMDVGAEAEARTRLVTGPRIVYALQLFSRVFASSH